MEKTTTPKKPRKKKLEVNEKHLDKAEAWQKLFSIVSTKLK
ncbi:hypothetical protein [Litchfieldia alkalitelluris]|nr:hypothetical protein [Litchfieldia alkalitelluris]